MVTRRQFLQSSALTGGGLLVACSYVPVVAQPASTVVGQQSSSSKAVTPQPPLPAQFGVYLEIHADGKINIVCPQSEMGQGVSDGLAKIVAEELDADWQHVQIQLPWADDRLVNPLTKRQRTANSDSTYGYFDLLRQVGAHARALLVAAAAQRWQVSTEQCTTRDSVVTHVPTGRQAPYGELAVVAAQLPGPQNVALKSPEEFRLIGRHTPRKDTPGKCDGSAVFGIDVRLPGMMYAALRRSSAVSSKVRSFDRTAALALPGVVDVVQIPDGIAVIAADTWSALRAAKTLQVEFDDTESASVNERALREQLRTALDDDASALPARPAFGAAPYDKARTMAALAAAPQRLEWEYEVPFLAHAALEPLNATAWLRDGECEVWAPSQNADRGRDAIAEITGLPREKCRLNITLIGGGFGRKWELDFLRQAVQIAAQVPGRPVKLTWTREQDFAHDRFRPAHRVRTKVGLAADGKVLAIHSRTTGLSILKYQNRPIPGIADPFAAGLLVNDRYALGERYVDFVAVNFPIPVGTWRSVSQSMNCFFSESAIDDIAASTRRDPLALRRELAAADPRFLAVLQRAAELTDWNRKRSSGEGRGIAISAGFNSYCAQVVEVQVTRMQVRVQRISCVFDCGLIVDPGNVRAQIEGGIVWGFSAARDGQVAFAAGAAVPTNFHNGPVLRFNQMPLIEIDLVSSDAKPGGAGEAAVPPVAPALASAIYQATGRRPRRLPLIAEGYEFI